MPLYDVSVEGVTYEVDAPDERTAWQWANYTHRQRRAAQPPAPKESTIGSEFVRGAKQLLSTSRTGIGALTSPEEAARAGVERSQQIAAEAGEGPSLAALRKVYEEQGLLPAAGELLSQVPRAVAGQVPQLAAMAGGAKLGAMAGAGVGSVVPVVGTGLGAIAGGVLGAGATLLPQFFGANVERQAAEQMQRGEPIDINRGIAAAAAAGQAGIEAAGTAFVLGKRVVKGILGVTDDAALATAKAREELVKAAARSRSGAALRGAGVGLAEIPVEVAQAVIERAQAGLDVLSPEALSEYGENAYLAGLVGPTIGAAARVTEPGAAKRKLAAEEQAKEAEARAAAAKVEEEKKAQPEYLEGLYTSYQDLLLQKNALDAQIKKGTKEAPLTQEDKDANAVVNRQLNELKKPLEEARKAFIDAGGPQAMQKLRAGRLELTPPPPEAGPPVVEEEEAPEAQRTRLTREASGLQALLEQQRTAMQEAETPEAAAQIAQRAQQTYDALAEANKTLGALPQAPDLGALKKEEAKLLEQFDDARAKGDQAAVMQIVPKLLEVRQQIQAAQPDLGLLAPEQAEAEQARRDALAEEMGAGREAAAATRLQSDTEIKFAREQAIAEAIAEQQRQEAAYQERISKLQEVRTAPQLGMFPEERETVTQTEKRAAPGKTQLDRQIESVTKQLGDVQRQLDEAQAAPTAIGGPWTDLQGAERTEYGLRFVEDLNKRKQQLENVLAGLRKQQEAAAAPAGARVERAPATALAPAQPDLRPQGPLAERLNVLAERVLAAPNVDEETKGLVRQVQDNLPLLLQRETRPERVLGKRGEMAAQQAEAASVGAWLYRTLQGTAPADLTQDVRNRLAELEAGKRSETEQVTQYAGRALTPQEQQAVAGTSLEGRQRVMTREPTGEVRRAVQTEIEMPEPTAKAFQSFGAFNDYLASEGLQAYRLQKGLVFPTLANLQKKLAPIQTRIQALQKQLDEVNTRRAALQKADVAERGAASELLREAQQKLKTVIQSLDDTARTTYVGQQLKKVDLVDLLDEAHGRLNAGLAHSANLREQFAQTLKSIASAEDATTPIMVDASGNATTNEKKAVRTVARGQLPGYQALRKAQLDLQAKGIALVQADQKLETVVKAGIGQSWDAGSPTLNAYLRAKKAKDEAQRAAQQAHYALVQAYKRVPSTEALNNNLAKFLNEKGSIDTEMAKAAKSLSAIRLGVRNASNRLNDAYTRAENNPDLRFGKSLLRLRNDLLAAESISDEAMGRSVERQAQSERLLQESRGIAQPMRTMKQQVSTALREAQQRAAERQVAPVETQAQREARDAEQRREEQARLERADTGPRTLVEFKRIETTDENIRKFAERLQTAATAQERAAIRKELDEYLKERIVKKEADLEDMKRKAAKNIQDLNTQRKIAAELTERLKGDLTPKRRESAEKQLAEAQRKVSEHQRRYTLNTQEMRVTRTDIQAQRQERNRLLAEASGRRVEGERLGVAEGTQARATGPVTRDEVTPPRTLRTGSEESRAGETTTPARMRYSAAQQAVVGERTVQEARGVQQRDVPITKAEMAEAEAQAAAMPTRVAREALNTFFQESKETRARAAELATSTEVAEIKDVKKVVNKLDSLIKQADKEASAYGVSDEALRRWEKASFELKTARAKLNVRLGKDVAFRETGPQYETRELTDLTPEVREALEDGDIRTALADLEKNGSTPFVRELAKRLGDMTMRTKLEVRDTVKHKAEEVEGAYLPAENLVLLHRNALSEEALTHELTHAATMRALEADPATLTPAQRAARKEIENLYEAIQKQPDFTREYGRKDVKEFVSELMSNLDFRNKLDAQKPSFIRRMYDAFMRLIGFPRAPASERAVKAAYKLFMPSQAIKAAPAASAQRGAPGLATANRVADSLIAKEKGVFTKLKENFLGMGARTQFVDKLAPTEEALKRGGTDPTKALQAMYYLRMYDQRMHFTSQSITEGVPERVEKTRRDGTKEYLIETKPGANIQQIVNILKRKDVVNAAGSPDAANKLFTLYLAARRAETKGYDKLNFKVSEADIKAARAEIEADPTLKKAFDEARDIYNQYNRNLLEFSVQTGALSRAEASRLLTNNDYIPYYRMRDGVAEMVIGGETPIRIGNLKDSPHLKELVGGDEAIFDFLTSSVQNTSMLLDMATKNLATKNLMFELRDVGLATVAKVPKSGKTPEGAVTFKRDGEDYFAVVDTDKLGIDSDLLVKGLAGIPTMFPAFIRVMGIPARILRRVVVASPVYMARQLFRDSTAATLASGANMVPVLSALKQIGKPKALQGRGITGGQVFTGMPEDVTRMLKDMQAGKISITNGLAWLEAKSAQADALTREAQYASYREQGLSEMEATLMSLESMNFSKRGLSPTMHMVSTLIPFFNAQIQGLDVLYKAFTGKMPLNERLAIREKLWTRGMMLAGLSMAYAVAMQDDETYKNARPEEKYGNWFVPVPGFDQMVRLPIPFELGYIFKALPEAMVNIVMNEEGGEEAAKALKHIVQQTIPGGSSYMIPQAIKPALEALAFEKSLFTGRSIESAREQMMEPGLRYRDNTTALAREVGELTGFSPIKLEFLISGYLGTLGMAALAALSAPFGKEGPESATKRASDMPVVGTIFQPNDASGIIDATYERMKRINEVKETYEGLIEKGRVADATKYLNENASEMALASVAGSFKQIMGDITKYEREVQASSLSPEEKRQKLDDARQMKIRIASSVRAMADKKEPQAALP